MSSSLKAALKRVTHKERAQPSSRKKYGLLEKKKDYVQRARDYHKKQKTIKHLESKAEQRNPDEFYFAMEKAQTKDGVHIQRSTQANKYSQEELLLMKTQDVKYLDTKSRSEAAKSERLKQSLHFIGMAPQNKHTVFVDDAKEAAKFKPSKYFDTPAELVGRAYNRPRNAQLQQQPAIDPAVAAKAEKRKHAAYRELAQRMERHQKLSSLAGKMEMDKQLMGKGRKRKLSAVAEDGSNTAVFKWKRERKK